jgi:hypothetical protein
VSRIESTGVLSKHLSEQLSTKFEIHFAHKSRKTNMKNRLERKFASKQIMKQCEYTLVTLMKAHWLYAREAPRLQLPSEICGVDIDGTMRGISGAAP